MDYKFTVKQLGNKWYLDMDHLDSKEISFNEKINKVFNLYDKLKTGQLTIELVEMYSIMDENTIFINDEDLFRYWTTSDDFDIHFIVRDIEFSISSDMYESIEYNFNPNFHKTIYRIEIYY